MELHGKLKQLPTLAKRFITAFLIAMTFGYGTGLYFLTDLMGPTAQGVQENYLGNEDQEDPEGEIKFKMSEREVITTIHDHAIAVSMVFFLIGALFLLTSVNPVLKKFLLIEPFISIILTFGGIYVLWTGVEWFKYVIMVSGTLMHLSFFVMVGVMLGEVRK